MKKLIKSLCICFFACTATAQDWPTVNIDSAISVQLPKGFEKTDTTDRVQLLASSEFGTIMVFKSEDTPDAVPEIEKDRHLDKYYDKYVRNISRSSKGGSIVNEKDTLLGNLKVKDFTLKVDSGSGKQYRDFRILHANGATYIFEYLYQYLQEELVEPERQRFFNSIKVDDRMDRHDQYTSPGMIQRKGISPAWLIGGGAIILAAVIIVILRLRRNTASV